MEFVLLAGLSLGYINWQELGVVRFRDSASEHNILCLSSKNKLLASGWDNGDIRIWDAQSGISKARLTTPGVTLHGSDLAFDSEALHCLALTKLSAIGIWEIATGKLTRTLDRRHDLILAVAISPDGKYVASGNSDDCSTLWQLDTGNESTITGHTSSVLSVAFSHDSKLLACGSRDGVVRVWDILRRKETNCLKGYPGRVYSLEFGKDNGSVICCSLLGSEQSPVVIIKRLSDGNTTNIIKESDRPALSPNGELIATISPSGNELRVLRVSDSSKILGWRIWTNAEVLGVSFESDSDLMLIGSDKNGLFRATLKIQKAK